MPCPAKSGWAEEIITIRAGERHHGKPEDRGQKIALSVFDDKINTKCIKAETEQVTQNNRSITPRPAGLMEPNQGYDKAGDITHPSEGHRWATGTVG